MTFREAQRPILGSPPRVWRSVALYVKRFGVPWLLAPHLTCPLPARKPHCVSIPIEHCLYRRLNAYLGWSVYPAYNYWTYKWWCLYNLTLYFQFHHADTFKEQPADAATNGFGIDWLDKLMHTAYTYAYICVYNIHQMISFSPRQLGKPLILGCTLELFMTSEVGGNTESHSSFSHLSNIFLLSFSPHGWWQMDYSTRNHET